MHPRALITHSVLVIGLLSAAQSYAQAQRSGGETQKMMQQYQQLAAERTSLQAQVAQLQKDLNTANADLVAVKKERDNLKGNAGTAAAAVERAKLSKQSADQTLEQSKQRMAELVAHYRDTAQSLKEAETDRAGVRRELSERNAAFDTCANDNLQLYEINKEVLDRYEHVGLFTKAAATEPFTRISRTRIQNLVDGYRARAEELRAAKGKAPAVNSTHP